MKKIFNTRIFLVSLMLVFSFIVFNAKAQVSCNGMNSWGSYQVYNTNDQAIYNGILYKAQWYTQGNQPDQGGPWTVVGTCNQPIVPNYVSCNGVSNWSSSTVYNANDQASFNGNLYKASWYTQNQQPDQNNAWQLIGVCQYSTLSVSGSLSSFSTIAGGQSSAQSFTLSGSSLTNNVIVSASANFSVSLSATAGFSSSFTITPSAGSVSSTVYVIYTPGSPGTHTGTITIASGGSPSQTLSVTGTASADWVVSGSNLYNANSGNVGIGLSSPNYKLDVNGTGHFTGFKLGSSSTAGYVLTSDNTGLGTWQPLFGGQLSMQGGMLTFSNDVRVTGKLHVGTTSLVLDGNAGSGTGNEIYNNTANADVLIQSHTATDGNTILNSQSGKVGIGLSNPLYSLDVNGTGNFKGFRMATGASIGKVLTSDANGIGTWQSRVVLGNQNNTIPDGYLEVDNNGDYGFNIVSHSTNVTNPTKLFVGTNGTDAVFFVTSTGTTRIGTKAPFDGTAGHADYMLGVDGKIVGRTVIATSLHWADFVFEPNYKLTSLKETEEFIKKNRHLPSVPSEAEVKANGVDMADMDAILLQKIEELYLHMIEMEKKNEDQLKQIDTLKKQIEELKK